MPAAAVRRRCVLGLRRCWRPARSALILGLGLAGKRAFAFVESDCGWQIRDRMSVEPLAGLGLGPDEEPPGKLVGAICRCVR